MNIYIQELKMSMRSALTWTLSMILLMVVFMSLYPAISGDAALMKDILAKFPPGLVKALGLSTFDLSDGMGYYAMFFNYILFIGAIYATKEGISALSAEVRDKTADFLLTKPVSRFAVVTSKFMSLLTHLVLMNLAIALASYIALSMIADKGFDVGMLLLLHLSLFLLQFFFMTLGLFLSVMVKRLKTVLPPAMGVVFGFFILKLLNDSISDGKLAVLTPFATLDSAVILKNARLDGGYVVVHGLMTLIFVFLGYWLYWRKDMPSV